MFKQHKYLVTLNIAAINCEKYNSNDKYIFNFLKALTSLSLATNQLKTLDECVFAAPDFYDAPMITLYLAPNPLVSVTCNLQGTYVTIDVYTLRKKSCLGHVGRGCQKKPAALLPRHDIVHELRAIAFVFFGVCPNLPNISCTVTINPHLVLRGPHEPHRDINCHST